MRLFRERRKVTTHEKINGREYSIRLQKQVQRKSARAFGKKRRQSERKLADEKWVSRMKLEMLHGRPVYLKGQAIDGFDLLWIFCFETRRSLHGVGGVCEFGLNLKATLHGKGFL